MIPVLFPASETAFVDERLQLTDAVSCTVREAVNGYSELSLKYPIIGQHFSEIQPDAIILAKPNHYTRPQPYRIYSVSKPMNGLVSFQARHLAYDGRGIPVAPFEASSAAEAAQVMKSNAVIPCPFSLVTDIDKQAVMKTTVPKTLRELVVTDAESWLHTYGGGLRFDFYTISLLQSPGENRGVVIEYGVDLIDVQQEENIANTYTGILPYWTGTQSQTTPSEDDDEDDEIDESTVTIMGSVRYASGTFPVQKILPVNLSEYFEDPPTVEDLNTLGDAYIASKGIGIPEVSLKVNYAQIDQDVRLYDTVTVRFALLGVDTTAQVSAVTFDSIQEIYTSIEVGVVRPQITDSLKDASRLTTGKLPSQRIAERSISGGKLGTAAVSERALAAYAVTAQKLAALSVSASKLQPNSVIESKLRDSAVTTKKIGNGAVKEANLGDGEVSYGKTSFTGTLDQVGVNKSDIAAHSLYFSGMSTFAQLRVLDEKLIIGNRVVYISTSGILMAR